MSTVEEAAKLLSRMTPGEKAQLLQRVAQESRGAYGYSREEFLRPTTFLP